MRNSMKIYRVVYGETERQKPYSIAEDSFVAE